MSQLFRLILGIATFCICIWIRFDLDFWEWVIEINWYTYWYCTYFIMITMILVVINSLIGAYAIIYVSKPTPLLTKDFTRCFHEIWNSFLNQMNTFQIGRKVSNSFLIFYFYHLIQRCR